MTDFFKSLNWKRAVKIGIEARYRKVLTQQELSELAGVSKPTIVNFEKERTNIKISNIIKILGLYQIIS